MNSKIFPVIALAVVLLSGGALAYSLQGSASDANSTTAPATTPATTTQKSSAPLFVSPAEWVSTVSQFVESIFEKNLASKSDSAATPASAQSSPAPAPQTSPTPSPTSQITPSPTSQTSPSATPKATPKASPAVQKKSTTQTTPTKTAPTNCRRFVVKHLDGSQSNRCYSDDDYSQLSRLAGQLSSAQTFYQFHLEGVARYQKLYDDSGSSLWLDARASSQAQADQEQSKIGPLQLQMYTIESRGTN
jgi:hypothetical protein